MKRIKIFDTTLRDGEQAPGCSMNLHEKIEVAKQLERLGVDIIEAGFAIASPGDFESISMVAKELKNTVVCSLARALEKDIDAAWGSVRHAVSPRIHTFIATSPVHMQYKLKMTPEQVLERTAAMVAYAKKYCPDVEFSAEDAGRSDLEFLSKVCSTAIKAGATVINIPDTVGYLNPAEITERLTYLMNHIDNVETVDVSVHNHNDLGLATANSLAAILVGATQVECTINGLGERAGNAALEEIVMGLITRKQLYQAECGIDTRQIYRTSRLVSTVTGMQIPANKAVVGQNAFAHESGIHQHGVMAERSTYEIMTPQSIGIPQNKMILGKHSGKHALQERLVALGYQLTEEQLTETFEAFKKLADKKKTIMDRDLETLVEHNEGKIDEGYRLDSFIINSGNTIDATASVKISLDGKVLSGVSLGSGPIDAGFTAINSIIGEDFELEDYSLHSITEGEDALGEAVVKLSYKGKAVTGRGVSTDIVEASLRAYLNGVNRALRDFVNVKEDIDDRV